MSAPVQLCIKDSVAQVTLCRPDRRNSLDRATIDTLTEILKEVDEDEGIAVMVLRGKGKSFCVGADLVEFGSLFMSGSSPSEDDLRAIAEAGDALIWRLTHLRPTTLCVVQGHAVGGGFLLAAGCDLRIASAEAKLAIPEVALGLPLAWLGVPLLTRELGIALARRLIMTGEEMRASALEWYGFLQTSKSPDELTTLENHVVQRLTRMPSVPLRMTKQHMSRPPLASAEERRLDIERFVRAMTDPGFLPSAARYLQKLRHRS